MKTTVSDGERFQVLPSTPIAHRTETIVKELLEMKPMVVKLSFPSGLTVDATLLSIEKYYLVVESDGLIQMFHKSMVGSMSFDAPTSLKINRSLTACRIADRGK